jgi:hypothetical protein
MRLYYCEENNESIDLEERKEGNQSTGGIVTIYFAEARQAAAAAVSEM